eukprot:scaffold151915_cov33-Tisochrysis_lutea.AAC.1
MSSSNVSMQEKATEEGKFGLVLYSTKASVCWWEQPPSPVGLRLLFVTEAVSAGVFRVHAALLLPRCNRSCAWRFFEPCFVVVRCVQACARCEGIWVVVVQLSYIRSPPGADGHRVGGYFGSPSTKFITGSPIGGHERPPPLLPR